MHSDGGNRLWNWPFLQLSDLYDLDLGLDHMAHHCITHRPLPTIHIKFWWNWKNFLWVDTGQTDVRTDTLLGQLGGVDVIILVFCSSYWWYADRKWSMLVWAQQWAPTIEVCQCVVCCMLRAAGSCQWLVDGDLLRRAGDRPSGTPWTTNCLRPFTHHRHNAIRVRIIVPQRSTYAHSQSSSNVNGEESLVCILQWSDAAGKLK